MKKPDKMPTATWIMRNIALEMNIPEETVKEVVNHQSSSAREAMLTNNSIELSGFGKFYFKENAARKRLKQMYKNKAFQEGVISNPDSTERRRKSYQYKLDCLMKNINIVESKLGNAENK